MIGRQRVLRAQNSLKISNCLWAQPKPEHYAQRTCAHRAQQPPPDGSAKCFGCLLVGDRRSGTPGDSFLVSRRALSRSRPRWRFEQFDAAGDCKRICCCFSPALPIRLLTTAHGVAGTCSGSFGSSETAFWVSRSRHLGSLTLRSEIWAGALKIG